MLKGIIKSFFCAFLFGALFSALSLPLAAKPAYTLDKNGLYDMNGLIVDTADLLTESEWEELDAFVEELESNTGIEIGVITLNSLGDDTEFELAMKYFDKWQLGKAGVDNGALLLVSLGDRALQIVTGDGTEAVLTDSKCARIRDEILFPAFRAENYGEGITKAVRTMAGIMSSDESLYSYSIPASETRRAGATYAPQFIQKIADIVDKLFENFILPGFLLVLILLIASLIKEKNGKKEIEAYKKIVKTEAKKAIQSGVDEYKLAKREPRKSDLKSINIMLAIGIGLTFIRRFIYELEPLDPYESYYDNLFFFWIPYALISILIPVLEYLSKKTKYEKEKLLKDAIIAYEEN